MAVYRVADYLRFSCKEDDKKESNSIGNQRETAKLFVQSLNKKYPEDEFILVSEYADDDFTGTNFNRPGFRQMVKDCKKGDINCIIVKDHSRFGRSAARMQVILEDDLDHVRYISNLDNFDSHFDDYDSMFQIKATFNQMYSEDISKKVHSHLSTKRINGEFVGSFCCYGYVKSKEDKHRLLIDEQVCDIVRLIFNKRLKGINIQTIARQLNELGIPAPSIYKKQQGLRYRNAQCEKFSATPRWEYSTIYRILTNETYKGNLTQGRKKQKLRRKPKAQSKEDWIIAKNAVPAIVTPEIFDEVQHLMREANHMKAAVNSKTHLFAGIIKCGECKKAFVKHQKGEEALYFVCGERRRHGKSVCENGYLRASVLENIILNDLNAILKEVEDLNQFVDYDSIDSFKLELEKQLNIKRKTLEGIAMKRRGAYSDYQDNFISKNDYIYLKEEGEKSEETLGKQIDDLQTKINCYTRAPLPWVTKLLSTRQIDELDKEIVQEMIESIYVYKNNQIDITYKFK